MKEWAKLYFFLDATFVLIFSVCCLIYANHDVFLIILVVVGLITVYPLYIYIDKCVGDEDKLKVTWYIEHFNMLMLYCLLRFFMLFGFFSWVLIDMAHVNVGATFSHFPVFVIVTLFIMAAIFIVLAGLALYIVPIQRRVVYKFIEEKSRVDSDDEEDIKNDELRDTKGSYFT
jgi:hypothetical protein